MFRIVVDSSCDLIFEAGSTHSNLFRKVPLTIMSDTKSYVDNDSLNSAVMMEELSRGGGKTGTSCPSPGAWEEAFDGADEIFALTITSKLSGSYNSARIARESYLASHPDTKIWLIDTFSCGSEISLLVLHLMKQIENGLRFEQLCLDIEVYRRKTALMFMLGSLENLIRNGRVSRTAGTAAKLLGINIIGRASDKGELEIVQKVRRSTAMYKQILDGMIRRGYHGGKVILSHCLNAAGADRLRELIRARFRDADVTIMATGGLCSFYAEIGGLLVGFET